MRWHVFVFHESLVDLGWHLCFHYHVFVKIDLNACIGGCYEWLPPPWFWSCQCASEFLLLFPPVPLLVPLSVFLQYVVILIAWGTGNHFQSSSWQLWEQSVSGEQHPTLSPWCFFLHGTKCHKLRDCAQVDFNDRVISVASSSKFRSDMMFLVSFYFSLYIFGLVLASMLVTTVVAIPLSIPLFKQKGFIKRDQWGLTPLIGIFERPVLLKPR